jgi:hypothetical protein
LSDCLLKELNPVHAGHPVVANNQFCPAMLLQELQTCVPAECGENIIRGVEKTPAYSTEHVWFVINDKQAFHGNTLLSLRRCFPMRVECITRRFVLKVFETGSVTI